MASSNKANPLDRPNGKGQQEDPHPHSHELFYTTAEIAEIWKVRRDVVRKIFRKEPGVLIIGSGNRRCYTMRIPESVMERVRRKLSNPDLTGAQLKA